MNEPISAKPDFTFEVNGLRYKVVEEPSGDNVYEDKDGRCCLGLCDYRKQTIYLLASQKSDRMVQTLRHEVTHSFIEAYANRRESYSEEDLCEFVSKFTKQINDIVDDYFMER